LNGWRHFGEAGRVTFRDFTFIHHLDKASPGIMLACATSERIPRRWRSARPVALARTFLLITFSEVVVTVVVPSKAASAGAIVEQVSLRAAKVDLEYKPQRADGSLDPVSISDSISPRTGPF
jgi:type VI secretion system secreted protein Hcp